MVAVNTTVEINRDGAWVPGIIVDVSTHRLVVAVNGDRAHRAYIARNVSNWRTVPKVTNNIRGAARRRAIQDAHNVFAGVR